MLSQQRMHLKAILSRLGKVLPSHFQRRDVICWHAPSAGVPEIAPRAVPRRSVIRCTTHLGFSVAEEPRGSKRMHSSHGPAIDTCLSQANGCTEHERKCFKLLRNIMRSNLTENGQ
ncbi:hypothetical protein CEXT_620681 [Caerostris extrusa]|uniref:Uncharacterized protein n=1 Tax=Caerostris extrusa TaxID=172846 RepID=A0AAV4NEF2_CAEEX|nr:hypothetical protein CEXT_620681 [Caerostris extrusa]